MAEPLDQTLNKLFEHFHCPICMSTLDVTYTTKSCAHRFCENCIKECINTLHRCPLCNHVLDSVDDIVRDNQYDDLIACASKLKEKSEENFMARLIDCNNNNNGETEKFSPLENVLKKYLMNILNSHQNYYKQLEKNFLNELKTIDDKASAEVELDPANKKQILKKAKESKERLEENFQATTKVICNAYDKYLSDNLPRPSVIQAPVRVRILKKDLKFNGLILKPNDDIKVVFEFIEKKVQETSEDKVIGYDESNITVFCFGPFSKYSADEIKQIYEQYIRTNQLNDNIQLIPSKDCMPVLEHGVKHDSELVICGQIKFESELPLDCFINKFDKNDDTKAIDYYMCETCGLNWICKNCSLVCHNGHATKPFIIGHKPTWACCYCKRKECNLMKK